MKMIQSKFCKVCLAPFWAALSLAAAPAELEGEALLLSLPDS